MRITWEDWRTKFKACPIIKVDGNTIKNVTTADDTLGIVEYVKAYKLKRLKGNVEIIGERIST